MRCAKRFAAFASMDELLNSAPGQEEALFPLHSSRHTIALLTRLIRAQQ